MDLPGHGKSADWDGTSDFPGMAVAMASALLEGPTDIIGHSFGAFVALRLAIERPDLVRSLTLYEPVFFAAGADARPDLAHENRAVMQEVQRQSDAGDPEMAARVFMRVWGDGRPWADLPEEMRRGFAARIGLTMAIQPHIVEDVAGILPYLGQIDVPVMLMDGACSPAVMKVVQDGLAERIKGAKRVTIEGAGHMGPITHPSEVARHIIANTGAI
jgi:pimeloyl-ACP methyl ester carboxylesterase